MVYRYPPNFPQTSRSRVKAEETRAGRDLVHAKEGGGPSLEAGIFHAVLRVVAVFADEALKLGRSGAWSVDFIDSEVRRFLQRTLVAWHRDREGAPVGDLISPQTTAVTAAALHKFENSGEWAHYQDSLIKVAEKQAAGGIQNVVDEPPEGLRDLSKIEPQPRTLSAQYASSTKLKQYRAETHLTQQELAERVGITPRAVKRHEAKDTRIRAKNLRQYEKVLSDLLGRPIQLH